MFYKPEIRNRMQKWRKALGQISVTQAAQAVAAQVVQIREFLEAQHLGGYLAIENELDPMPIIQSAQNLKKKLYLPVINPAAAEESEPFQFYAYTVGDPLQKDLHGISVPAHRSQSPFNMAQIDLILLPLLAFDSQCNRLGRGAGHYDRALNNLKRRAGRLPYLMGLAYEFQKIPQIVADKWDVPMDIVVTEENVYRRIS